jgi:hypothetical protein
MLSLAEQKGNSLADRPQRILFKQTFVLNKYIGKNKRISNPICAFVNNIKEINFNIVFLKKYW